MKILLGWLASGFKEGSTLLNVAIELNGETVKR
jgi:hypothetical protein